MIFNDVILTKMLIFSVTAYAPSAPILFSLEKINEFKQN